ncbi:hypothetical protein DSAG12_03921 [Promethearchaeum syntrophicum]|uniref:Uncharacterized protein n=1 Tax=Promethearchaeum syntrophicum TaxID=2594042 RepID=A0A5B9DH65_9ARCH|nr:hypothetical protein [Candidatus Prometheoarchaeum syntrophicum]
MKEKTKKSILQACLGFYWGFNIIALLIYEVFRKIFSRDKSAKDSYDESEYAKIFWYLISIPAISIVVLILFSRVGLYYLFPIFNIIYAIGIAITAGILIFSKESIYIFDKKGGETLSNYKDFGNVLLMDIIWQIISIFLNISIYNNNYAGLINHLFITIFLSWGFYLFKKSYSGEKETRKDRKTLSLLLEFSSKDPHEMEKNIHQVQKLGIEAIKAEDLNLAEEFIKNSTKKYQKSIEQFRKKYPQKSSQFKADFFKSKSLLDTISKLKIALKSKNQKEIKKFKSKMRHLMEQLI